MTGGCVEWHFFLKDKKHKIASKFPKVIKRLESKKISIASHGFEIKEKGNVVHFNGKNIVKIK